MSNSILHLMIKNCCYPSDSKPAILKKVRNYIDYNNYPYIDDLENKIGGYIL
jgi:hypothetical protein